MNQLQRGIDSIRIADL